VKSIASARWERAVSVCLAVVALAAVVQLGYLTILYASIEGYIDHIEHSIALGGWHVLQGLPLYQAIDDWPFFGNFYGPLVYLVQTVVFVFAQATIPLSKLANALAVAGSFLFIFLHLRRRFDLGLISFGIIVIAANFLIFIPISVWNRPDPFLFFLVSAALYAGGRFGGTPGAVFIGVCIGLAVNFKVHAFVYFLPLIVDVYGWRNLRRMAFIVAVSLAVFFLPFALPQVSFVNYVGVLFHVSQGKSVASDLLRNTLTFAVFYLMPGLLLLGLALNGKRTDRRDMIYFAVLSVCIIISAYPASIPGSGIYHLAPLLPVVVDATARLLVRADRPPWLKPVLMVIIPVAFLAVSFRSQINFLKNIDWLIDREKVAREVAEAASAYSDGSLQVGYGDSRKQYQLTFYKPILAFAGQPVSVDARVLMEAKSINFDISGRLVEELRQCRTKYWLIPKGQQPFRMRSFYSSQDIFGSAPEVFAARYEKTAVLKYFDVWSCKP